MMKLMVLCCVVVAAAARAPVYFTPAGVPLASTFGYPAQLQQPLYNYRGPLSLAPGQPANILAADGRPLDTLDVNLDRSAHFVAKAIDNGSRVLKKRSVTRLAVAPGLLGYAAGVAAGNVGPTVVGPAGVATSIATNPIGVSVPIAPAFGIASPLVAGGLVSTPIAAGSLAVSTPFVAGPVPVSAVGTPLVRNF